MEEELGRSDQSWQAELEEQEVLEEQEALEGSFLK
jgi:hypothetical protein